MKQKPLFTLISFLLLILPVAALALATNTLISNGDFEKLDANGSPEGWVIPGGGNLSVVTEDNGNHYIRITDTNATQDKRLFGELAIHPAWKTLIVSARLKATNLELGDQGWQNARVMLAFEGADGKRDSASSPQLSVDSDWVTLSVTLPVPVGAKVLKIEPGNYGKGGTLCVDDIVVMDDKAGATLARSTVDGAEVDETKVSVTWVVNPSDPTAADSNVGTETAPFKTLGHAVNLAMANKVKGIGTKVLIYPGIYRESIAMSGSKGSSAPIVLESKIPGKAVLSGSEIWTGWTLDTVRGASVHAWPYKWGVGGNPWEKDYQITIEPIVRRRELIVVDNQVLKQVLDLDKLTAGCFFVDEDQGKVYIKPQAGVDISQSTVEVGVRTEAIRGKDTSNIVLRGLVVQHVGSAFLGSAVNLSGVQNVLVEDCRIIWNNARGLSVEQSYDITYRRLVANDNGYSGTGGGHLANILFEDVETARNNWRGVMGGWTGWDLGGTKLLGLHKGTFRRYHSFENSTTGFWLDWDCEDIVIEDSSFERNLTTGMGYEGSKGPYLLKNSVIRDNVGPGLHIHSASQGTVDHCLISGNLVQISLYRDDRKMSNWEDPSQESWTCKTLDWTLANSVISSAGPSDRQSQLISTTPDWFSIKNDRGRSQPLFHSMAPVFWKPFVETLRSDYNVYYHPTDNHIFLAPDGKTPLALGPWQKATGQDLHSVFGKPDSTPRPHGALASLPPTMRNAGLEFGAATASGFKLTADVEPRRLSPLALEAVVNRPLTGIDAWVGLPFSQLKTGAQMFHGIPFQIPTPKTAGANAVVALKSTKIRATSGKPLPEEVVLPVGRRATALYVLHGCGYGVKHATVGQYRLVYADGSDATVDVVVRGETPAESKAAEVESNIQDWWPSYPQFENDNARSVQISDTDGNARFLYVLQWVNPFPTKIVKELRLSSDPTQEASLMILGVTLLAPPEQQDASPGGPASL